MYYGFGYALNLSRLITATFHQKLFVQYLFFVEYFRYNLGDYKIVCIYSNHYPLNTSGHFSYSCVSNNILL